MNTFFSIQAVPLSLQLPQQLDQYQGVRDKSVQMGSEYAASASLTLVFQQFIPLPWPFAITVAK